MAGSITVLHVGDDPAITASTATGGEDDRFVVETAADAADGLSRLDEGDVDCVVSDYELPGRDGIEFLRAVRERHGDLPFVLFTGKGNEEVASDAISAGVTDYLRKRSGTEGYAILAHRISNAVAAHRSRIESEDRRQRLEGILKTVPGCVTQLDAEGRFVFANDRAVEVLGLERDAVTDRAYNDPEWGIRDLDGEPIPDADLPFRRVRDTGEPIYDYRHTIRWPDGTEKELLINGAPLFGGDGTVESVVFSMVDVTDRRERARTLRETESRLELALEATGTGVWEWNVETGAVVWDETLERVMGLEPGSFEGTYEAFADRVHPDDLPAVEDAVERALETGDKYRIEFRMLRPDGEVLWVEGRAQVFDDDDGRRMIGVHHDITERKRRERELERATRRLDGILDNTTMPMFMKDADGTYLLVNRGYEDLFGLDREAVIGRTDAEIHPRSMVDEVRANDRRVVDEGESLTAEERIVVDGEEHIFLATKVPIFEDVEGEPAVFGVAKDITEREAYRRKLERQNELLEEFAGVVSHDLRSPLTVAQGRIELARDDCDSPHLADAADALDRSQNLIDELLTLAREGAGTGEVEPVPLADAVEWCWRDIESPDCVLTVETTRTVRAAPSRLRQLLGNLLRNSVEHGSTGSQPTADDAVEHGGPAVTVTVGDLPNGFYVADDGSGIPEAIRDRVFESGYSTADGNTGFGLDIVSQVAADHGWRVSVVESDGGGARFEITGVE